MLSPRGSSSTVKIQTSICLQLQDCLLEGLDHLLKLWNWSQRCFGQKRKSCNFVRPLVFFCRETYYQFILDLLGNDDSGFLMFILVQQGLPWPGISTEDTRRIRMAHLSWEEHGGDSWPEILPRIRRRNRSCCWRVRSSMLGLIYRWALPGGATLKPVLVILERIFFSVSICVQWQYILIYFVVSLTPFFHLSCFWEATHITCWPACINVMMIHVHDLKTIAAWFPVWTESVDGKWLRSLLGDFNCLGLLWRPQPKPPQIMV